MSSFKLHQKRRHEVFEPLREIICWKINKYLVLVRDSCKCKDVIVRELVRTVTENAGFIIFLLNIRLNVTAWKDK